MKWLLCFTLCLGCARLQAGTIAGSVHAEAKEFDLGLYKDPEIKRVTFDKLGRVDVFCSIHASMNCTVLVLPNAWFATTDEKGHYDIANIPSGTYKVKAWHRRLPSETKNI